MGVELPLRVVVTILECCVTFSGVKLSIRSFVLFICKACAVRKKLRFSKLLQYILSENRPSSSESSHFTIQTGWKIAKKMASHLNSYPKKHSNHDRKFPFDDNILMVQVEEF